MTALTERAAARRACSSKSTMPSSTPSYPPRATSVVFRFFFLTIHSGPNAHGSPRLPLARVPSMRSGLRRIVKGKTALPEAEATPEVKIGAGPGLDYLGTKDAYGIA